MATTTISTFTAVAGKLINDTAIQISANASGVSSGRVYMVEIDNTLNSSAVYLKIRDTQSLTAANLTVTTANGVGTPDFMFYAPSGKSITYAIPNGHAYTSGLSIWCVTDAAVGTTVYPSKNVEINILCS
jgi:hypothetical protein|tara:strand:+ start:536 stop:925 length:390 start_codon:yes stop_codon:yes gene_type:complete